MATQLQTQAQTQTSQVSDQTTSLEKLVEKLEELGRIEELRDNVQWLRNLATELKHYVEKDASTFVIRNMYSMIDISIVGRYTGCVYFDTSIDPKNTTIYDVFDKFFSADISADIYVNALRCIADALNDIANIIDSALPEPEEDP